MFCRKCGTKLLDDSLYCDKCGEKIFIPDNTTTQSDISSSTNVDKNKSNLKISEEDKNTSPLTIQQERSNAIKKRIITTQEAQKKKKVITIVVIAVVVALITVLIVNSAIKSAHNNELRNFATETMSEDYNNVYADVISIEPEYFVYTSFNNGAYNLSEIVCKCVTVEGKTIWAAIDVYEYPGGSSIEERNEPQYYSKENPKRIFGRVQTSKQVMDKLVNSIGNVLVLDVTQRVNK